MSAKPTLDEIQQIQTAYRRRILDCWNISAGSRILEIGCGQGDMTTVLAEAVGPEGIVTATDPADRDYGSPLTLGEATDRIKNSDLGERVTFLFGCSLWDRQFSFGKFDRAILAHCSWYFASGEELKEVLTTLTMNADILCFAEWDATPTSIEQLPHYLAVLIQGQIEAFQRTKIGNIRSPFTVTQLRKIIEASGWIITKTASPDTSDLQDADWEIAECLANSLDQAKALNLSPNHLMFIEGQLDTLRQMAKPSGNRPLNSIAFVAERN